MIPERRLWRWIKWAPVLGAALLILLQVAYPDAEDGDIVSYIWFVVSFISLVLSEIVRRHTRNLLIVAKAKLGNEWKDGSWMFNIEINHTVSVLMVLIHILFCTVGLVSAVVEEIWLRRIISVNSLLMGQFLLLMIVAATFLSYRVTAREMKEDDKKAASDLETSEAKRDKADKLASEHYEEASEYIAEDARKAREFSEEATNRVDGLEKKLDDIDRKVDEHKENQD